MVKKGSGLSVLESVDGEGGSVSFYVMIGECGRGGGCVDVGGGIGGGGARGGCDGWRMASLGRHKRN